MAKVEIAKNSRERSAEQEVDRALRTLERRAAGHRCRAAQPPRAARRARACGWWAGRRRRPGAARPRRGRWARCRSRARSSSTRSSPLAACPSGCPAGPQSKLVVREEMQEGRWQELEGWRRGPWSGRGWWRTQWRWRRTRWRLMSSWRWRWR